MAKSNGGLYDVEVCNHHGAKPGFSARGLTRDEADAHAEAMATAHPGKSYKVVAHNPKA